MLEERIQRIRGGYATVLVGGATEAEQAEREDRIKDAILAAQSALREGYTLGGGIHYLKMATYLRNAAIVPDYLGTIITSFLEAVFTQVHINSGVDTLDIYAMIMDMESNGYVDIIQMIDFSGERDTSSVEDYLIVDSAGTPVRVLEAVRSLISTLLPTVVYIPRQQLTVDM